MFTKAVLFLKPDAEEAFEVARHVCGLLKENNLDINMAESHQDDAIFQADLPDVAIIHPDKIPEKSLAIAIGGDGTYLYAARKIYNKNAALAGINLGKVGFLTDCHKEDTLDYLQHLLNGTLIKQQRPLQLVQLLSGGKEIMNDEPFINEVVVQRDAHEKMLRMKIIAADAPCCNLRADGLILASALGSTAYNLSAGGPIMHPESKSFVLNAICPHGLTFRPLVLPRQTLEIRMESSHGQLIADGRKLARLNEGDCVRIMPAPEGLTRYVPPEGNFYQHLRQKLGWANTL